MAKKIIVILGGSGEIGSSIALNLKNEYKPFLIARNEDRLKEVSKKIHCDYAVSDINDKNSYIETLKKIKDPIYGFAYCVGSISLKSIKNSTKNDFLDSFNINVLGAITGIQTVLEQLVNNKGSILLFSTIAVKNGFSNHSIIASSKGAIEGLTRSLAAELSPEVRVNCIAPSLVESKMSNKIISNSKIAEGIAKMHPIPKLGKGKDFGALGALLLTDFSSWITGQIYNVDGGRSSLNK